MEGQPSPTALTITQWPPMATRMGGQLIWSLTIKETSYLDDYAGYVYKVNRLNLLTIAVNSQGSVKNHFNFGGVGCF